MNRRIGRPHTVAVVMATSLAVATACSSPHRSSVVTPTPVAGSRTPTTTATTSAPVTNYPTAPPVPVAAPVAAAAPQLTVTDGTATLTTDGHATTFPSTVTDGAWSPDGSRLAYVDGTGNIATARGDGSDVAVLTKTDPRVKRAEPTWTNGNEIVFTERGADGVWRLKQIYTVLPAGASPSDLSGSANPAVTVGEQDWIGGDGDAKSVGDTAPQAASHPLSAHGPSIEMLTYQHAGPHGPQVWIIDFNQREPASRPLTDGTAPTTSPDGDRVAYVGAGDQLYIISADGNSKAKPVQVTFGIAGIHDARFTPDGSRLVFGTATDIESVSARLATGVHTNPARVESTRPGVPSLRPMAPGAVTRLAGTDPVADAITLSRRMWNPYNAPQTAYGEGSSTHIFSSQVTLVGTGDRNALYVAANLSHGPVLFTAPGALDPRDLAEMKRIIGAKNQPQDLNVLIVGDTRAISAAVQKALTKQGFSVQRVDDAAPATLSTDNPHAGDRVAVVSMNDMAAVANLSVLRQWYHVILVNGRQLPAGATNVISVGTSTVAIGADAAAALTATHITPTKVLTYADTLTESLALGADPRYAGPITALADPTDWHGLLLAASQATPVLAVPTQTSLSPAARTWLSMHAPAISSLVVCATPAALPDGTVADATTLISGPAGATTNGLLVW